MLRQLPVAANLAPHDVGDHFFVRRADDELAAMAILEAQQFGTILLPAAGLLPQFGRLHGGHEQLNGAGAIHLFAHDALDLAHHAQTHWHPRIDAGGEASDHAGTQHQLVADDFRVGGGFLKGGDKKLTGAHG